VGPQEQHPYQTAWNWFSTVQLPVPARQTATGTILVDEPPSMDGKAALYARVSSHDHKANLHRQVARLSAFAAASALTAYLCALLAKICKLTSHLF
jgi:putative resolvase